jgi:hypothetical protein
MLARVLRSTDGASTLVGNARTPERRDTDPGTKTTAGTVNPDLNSSWGCAMCYADACRDDTETVGPFVASCYCGWSDNGHPTMESAERAAQLHQQNDAD